MQTQVGWEAPREEGKCLCAGTHLPSDEQIVAMIQGSSRGGVSLGSCDTACPWLLSPTCLFLFPSQKWGGMGAVEALAVGLRMADRSAVCHPLSGKVWPPLGDPTLAWFYSHEWHLSLFAEGRGHTGLSACSCL